MRALNALMFRSLDIVVTIGRDTERLLLRYGGKTSDKIHFIPNWAGARRSRDCSRQSLSRRFPLHSRPDHQAISA